MLTVNVLNKFHNEKLQKAPEIRKSVKIHSLQQSVSKLKEFRSIRSGQMMLSLPLDDKLSYEREVVLALGNHYFGVVHCSAMDVFFSSFSQFLASIFM